MAYIRRESDVNNRPFTDCGYKYRVSVRLVSVRVCWRESAAAAAVACAVTGQPASERSAVLPGCWQRSNMSASNTSNNVPGVNLLVVGGGLGAARLFLSM